MTVTDWDKAYTAYTLSNYPPANCLHQSIKSVSPQGPHQLLMDMAMDDEDDEWGGLIDQLLSPEPETPEGNEAQSAANQPSHDSDSDWHDFVQQLVVPEGARPSPPVVPIPSHCHGSDRDTWSVSMFGSAQELVNIGCSLQKALFDAFRKSFAQKGKDPSSSGSDEGAHTKLCNEVMDSIRFLSIAALADKLNVPSTTAGRMITHLACVLVYAACFLIGCLFCSLCNMFSVSKRRRFKAVAVINVLKYDETPLKLGVNEWKSFVGSVAPLHVQKKRHKMRQGCQQTEVYCHTKVLAVDWRYGALPGITEQNFLH